MSSVHPSQKNWQALVPNQTVEIGLVQVKLSYKNRAPGDYGPDMRLVWDIFRDSFHAVAELRGGKLFSWRGLDGAFMFLIENDDSFDNCCLAAIQMLEMVPSINEDIRLSTDIGFPIEVCVLCDTGDVAYDPEPARTAGGFVEEVQKYCRDISAEGAVIVTDRVHRQLSRSFTSRFQVVQHSPELGVDLHSTIPLPSGTTSSDLANNSPQPAVVESPPDPAGIIPRAARKLASLKCSLERNFRQLKPQHKIAMSLVAACFVGILIGQFALPSSSMTSSKIPGALNSAEWIAWQRHAHKILSQNPVTERSVVDSLEGMPAVELKTVSAMLRRDQAIADVLMSARGVAAVLKHRLGIDEHFLGTGLSKMVHEASYREAYIHEYLIPNHRVEHPQVWMRRFNYIGNSVHKTVKEVISEESDLGENRDKPELRQEIINRVETIDTNKRPPPVIRFARLKKDQFKNRLGRDERFRVFASDLAEVWNRKLMDAADLSGYNTEEGDQFFIWVFVPANHDQAVPATWAEVLKNIPIWFEEGEKNEKSGT